LFPLIDEKGNLEVWLNKRETIPIGPNEELPLTLNFSSVQDDVQGSILGESWWFPLFESTVRSESKRKINLRLPGGQSRQLYARGDGEYATPDGDWVGKVDGDEFTVNGHTGWTLQYVEGRLKRGESPAGKGISWDFESDRPSAIRVDGDEVARLSYSPLGIVSKLEVFGDGPEERTYEFTQTRRPVFQTLLGSEVVREMVPSIEEVRKPSGKRIRVRVRDFLEEGNVVAEIREEAYRGRFDEGRTVRYDNDSGALLSDDLYTYRRGERKDGTLIFERTNRKSGRSKKVEKNRRKGITQWTFVDGSSVKVIFANINGEKSPRKTIRRNGESEVTSVRRNYFDSRGELIRATETDEESGEVQRTIRASAETVNEVLAEHGTLEALFSDR